MEAIKSPKNVCFCCLKKYKSYQLVELKIPALGYGSQFDGFSTKLQICGSCSTKTPMVWQQLETVDTDEGMGFKEYKYEKDILDFANELPVAGRELFFNRYAEGFNTYTMEPQDWIDYECGRLSDKKCKEYGLRPKSHWEVIRDRLLTCQHVANITYEDGSYGITCLLDRVYTNCVTCKYFEEKICDIQVDSDELEDFNIYYIAKIKHEEFKYRFGEI